MSLRVRVALGIATLAAIAAIVVIAVLTRPGPPLPSPTPTPTEIVRPSPTPAETASPTPTPSPSPTPTPSPTPSPTPVPTPTPKPPAVVIAETWQSVRSYYPWMPEVVVRFDVIPEAEPAYYGGLLNGIAVISIKPTTQLGTDAWVAWHEAGHAVLEVASRLSHTSTEEILTAYWQLRRFPGTWQDQQRKAEAAQAAGESGFIVHQMLPQEMFADTFAAAHVDSFADGTIFPGIAFDRAKMREFYASLPTFIPTGLVTKALGPLQGEWVFTNRTGSYRDAIRAERYPSRGEVWAAAPSGAFPRYVATYVTNLGPGLPDSNEIRRQLSPNGKQLVLSAGLTVGGAYRYALVIIDLETGAHRLVTTDSAHHDVSPAWSPDGSTIAFGRRSIASLADAGLWLVAPDGSGLRRLQPGAATRVHGWTADSSGVAFGDGTGEYRVVDARTGVVRAFAGIVGVGGASWRRAVPAFVGSFTDLTATGSHIDVADAPGAAQRVVLRDPGFALGRPRWSPAGPEILYRSLTGLGIVTLEGRTRAVPTTGLVLMAEWTRFAEVAYVAQDAPLVATIRLVAADGTRPRDLASIAAPVGTWQETYRDLAVVAYP